MVNRRDFGKISLAAGLAATIGRPAWAASAADTAVKAAQQYKGRSITIVWEAGLQSLDPTHFSGPNTPPTAPVRALAAAVITGARQDASRTSLQVEG